MPVHATYLSAKVHEPKKLLFISHKSGLRWDAATYCSPLSLLIGKTYMVKKAGGMGGEPPSESAMTRHPSLFFSQNSEKCMKQLGKEWTCLIGCNLDELGRFGRSAPFDRFGVIFGSSRSKGKTTRYSRSLAGPGLDKCQALKLVQP